MTIIARKLDNVIRIMFMQKYAPVHQHKTMCLFFDSRCITQRNLTIANKKYFGL